MLGVLRRVGAFLAIWTTAAIAAGPAALVDETLPNGVRVIAASVRTTGGEAKLVEHVAVSAFYEVGIIHEPAGLTQAAHLVEHLVCYGATASFKAGESFAALSALGMTNAETLGDHTRFDLAGPPDKLDELLRIEAERLTSVRFTPELVAQERPRIDMELKTVEGVRSPPLLKFALMAATQGWRHGKDFAPVRDSFASLDLKALEAFHARYYRPDRLTLVIVGGVEPARALELARARFGVLKNPEQAPAGAALDEPIKPVAVEMRWNARSEAAILAATAPESPRDRVALSLIGQIAMQRLVGHAEMDKAAKFRLTTMPSWPVGALPIFAYGTIEKTGSARAFAEHAGRALSDPLTDHELQMLRAMLMSYRTTITPSDARIQQGLDFIQKQRGDDPAKARALVVGQEAINVGMWRRWLGKTPENTIENLDKLSDAQWRQIHAAGTAKNRLTLTRLIPEAAPAQPR